MTVPEARTTITVERPGDVGTDPTDAPVLPPVTVATGVPAVLASPRTAEEGDVGSQETVTWRLLADPCDLTHIDTVVDETTTLRYAVVSGVVRRDVGGELDHMAADVRRVTGAA